MSCFLRFALVLSSLLMVPVRDTNAATDWDAVEGQATHSMVFVFSYLQPVDPGQPRLFNPLWKGSGFVVTAQGHILTAAHLIPEERQGYNRIVTITLARNRLQPEQMRNGTYRHDYQMKVLHRETSSNDYKNDIALLKNDTAGPGVVWSPLCLGDEKSVRKHDVILKLGYAEDLRLRGKIGKVSSPNEHPWNVDISVSGGDSGGPVLTEQGHVVGLVIENRENNPTFASILPISAARNALQLVSPTDLPKCPARPTETHPTETSNIPVEKIEPQNRPGGCQISDARNELKLYKYDGITLGDPVHSNKFGIFHGGLRNMLDTMRQETDFSTPFIPPLLVSPPPGTRIEDMSSVPTIDLVKNDWRSGRSLISVYGAFDQTNSRSSVRSKIYWGDWGSHRPSSLNDVVQSRLFEVRIDDDTVNPLRDTHSMMVFVALAMDALRRNCDPAIVNHFFAKAAAKGTDLQNQNALTPELLQVQSFVEKMRNKP